MKKYNKQTNNKLFLIKNSIIIIIINILLLFKIIFKTHLKVAKVSFSLFLLLFVIFGARLVLAGPIVAEVGRYWGMLLRE